MSIGLSQVSQLKQRIDSYLSAVQAERIKQSTWETERTKLLLSVGEKRELQGTLVQVVELFKQIGGENEREILERIQDFISYGLRSVFGSDYQFTVEMRTEGKELKVDFGIRTGELRTTVVGAKGGGLAECVSVLLQLFFVLVDKSLSRFVVLDAALIHLSERYWKNMSQLLSEICTRTDIQILLLAHAEDYGDYADRLYRFTQVGGKTVVEKVR